MENGWGSWDVRCLNAALKTPELAEIRILVYDARSRQIFDELRWDALLGYYTTRGEN
jgi:hypothetical protein